MVLKWDTGAWRLRDNTKVVPMCSILASFSRSQPHVLEAWCFSEPFSGAER